MNKFAYFPGCSLSSTAKEYDISTRIVCDDLGIELLEVPHWVCCGATTAHITSELASYALPAKTLIWAEKNNLPVTSPCSACFSRLAMAHNAMKNDPELRKEVSEIVGEEYHGKAEVLHLARVFYENYGIENIKKAVKKQLSGLKVASYYGCLMTRPPEVCDFDRIENPTFMDKMVDAVGAIPVKWGYKTECCGAAFSLTKKEAVIKLTGDILSDAKECGADIIMVACPLCQTNLDTRQAAAEKNNRTKYNLPVLYFTQIIALALGYSGADLAFKKHFVNPTKVLRSKNIII
ncbi:MAG: CoB--CoM heterodisulfide reductase iron-sulfur subunit B family protein [Candidatus Firestonebacteria bacterium]